MPNYSIIVENINLTYRLIHSTSLKKRVLSSKKPPKVERFLALKDVSFKVQEGQNVGLIGANGSGKTTLLKALAGIFHPDSGNIILSSESVSLLALGAGFETEMNGLDNIYLNGALLGFSRTQIDQRLEDIIAFADIGEFIYNPIRTYSSGMKARLAFAIASSIDPDILLIDEMLGVGDENFREKSRERIKSMISSNRTVVIAAHQMSTIRDICDQVLWLEKGSLVRYGNTDDVVSEYLEYSKRKMKG
jgi:teichoic acid transport system ATP-binding protein